MTIFKDHFQVDALPCFSLFAAWRVRTGEPPFRVETKSLSQLIDGHEENLCSCVLAVLFGFTLVFVAGVVHVWMAGVVHMCGGPGGDTSTT